MTVLLMYYIIFENLSTTDQLLIREIPVILIFFYFPNKFKYHRINQQHHSIIHRRKLSTLDSSLSLSLRQLYAIII